VLPAMISVLWRVYHRRKREQMLAPCFRWCHCPRLSNPGATTVVAPFSQYLNDGAQTRQVLAHSAAIISTIRQWPPGHHDSPTAEGGVELMVVEPVARKLVAFSTRRSSAFAFFQMPCG
jgi:hypothetical protein